MPEIMGAGAALFDYDNDGDMDILVTNNNGPARMLLNQAAQRSHWLQVKLVGVKDNRDGIGAKVAVIRKNAKPIWGRVHTGGSYLAASDPRVHFGLGDEASVEAVRVIWPGRSRETWTNVKVDSVNTLRQGAGKSWMR